MKAPDRLAPIVILANMKTIPLSQGRVAIVDDADFDALITHRWCASLEGRCYYAVRNVRLPAGKWTTEKMHRVILGASSEYIVDHVNGDGLDNRRTNLRIVSSRQNHQNKHRKPIGTTSRFKGVSWHASSKRWRAQICDGPVGSDGHAKNRHLGLFASEVEAARAYNAAAVAAFGEFARLNFTETP